MQANSNSSSSGAAGGGGGFTNSMQELHNGVRQMELNNGNSHNSPASNNHNKNSKDNDDFEEFVPPEVKVHADINLFKHNENASYHKLMMDFVEEIRDDNSVTPYDLKTRVLTRAYDADPMNKIQCIHSLLSAAQKQESLNLKVKVCDITNHLINRLHGFGKHLFLGNYTLQYLEVETAKEVQEISIENSKHNFQFLDFILSLSERMPIIQERVSNTVAIVLIELWCRLNIRQGKLTKDNNNILRNSTFEGVMKIMNLKANLLTMMKNTDTKRKFNSILGDLRSCLVEKMLEEPSYIDMALKVLETRGIIECQQNIDNSTMDDEAYAAFEEFLQERN